MRIAVRSVARSLGLKNGEQAGGERPLIAFARQRERLDLRERQKGGEIVLAVECAHLRQQALLAWLGRLRLISDRGRRSGDSVDRREIQRRRASERRRGQLEGLDLGRQRRAIGVVGEDRVSVLALGQRRERLALLVEGRRAALIADRGGAQGIAVGVDFQRQRMADARVGRVALVVIVDALAGVAEEDRMTVRPLRLQVFSR